MARLINDSGVLGETTKVTAKTINNVSFDKIIDAIHTIQTEMGISGITWEEATKLVESGAITWEEAYELLGTTAKESSTTITGSINTAKAAWTNWLISLSNGSDDSQEKFEILAKSVGIAVGNISTAATTAIGSISGLVGKWAEEFINAGETDKTFVDVGFGYVNKIFDGLNKGFEEDGVNDKLVIRFLNRLGDELTAPENLGKLIINAKKLASNIFNWMAEVDTEGGLGKLLDNITDGLKSQENNDASKNLGRSLGNLIASVFDIGPQDQESIGDKINNVFWAAVDNSKLFLVGLGESIWGYIVDGFTSSDNNWLERFKDSMDASGLLGVIISEIDGTRDSWFHKLFDLGPKIDVDPSTVKSYKANDGKYILNPFDFDDMETNMPYINQNQKEETATTKNEITININGTEFSDPEELAEYIAKKIKEETEKKDWAHGYQTLK